MSAENRDPILSVSENGPSDNEETESEVEIGTDAPSQTKPIDVPQQKVSGSLTKATMVPFKDHKQGEN